MSVTSKLNLKFFLLGLLGSALMANAADKWSQKDLGTVKGGVTAMVNSHGAVLLRIHQLDP